MDRITPPDSIAARRRCPPAPRQATMPPSNNACTRSLTVTPTLKVPDSEAGLRSPAEGPKFPTVTRLIRTASVSRSVRLTAAHE